MFHPTIKIKPYWVDMANMFLNFGPRHCDASNRGVSDLCSLTDPTWPEPRIWAEQVIKEYGNSPPEFISGLKTSRLQYLSGVGGSRLFRKMDNDYEAYEKDIAMVQVRNLWYLTFHLVVRGFNTFSTSL